MPLAANKERLLRLLFVKEWMLETLMLDLLDYCIRFNSYAYSFDEGSTFHEVLSTLRSMRNNEGQRELKDTLLNPAFFFDDEELIFAVENDVQNVISTIEQIKDRFQMLFRNSN